MRDEKSLPPPHLDKLHSVAFATQPGQFTSSYFYSLQRILEIPSASLLIVGYYRHLCCCSPYHPAYIMMHVFEPSAAPGSGPLKILAILA